MLLYLFKQYVSDNKNFIHHIIILLKYKVYLEENIFKKLIN